MELTGDLKKQVDNAEDIEAKRSLIEKAGMKLTEDELSKVAGGIGDNKNYVMEASDPGVDRLGPPPPLSPFGSVSDSYDYPV